jgi:2-polyprenyl-3-methyl-5-hydroxy-6-metoxy-1,4-benzoquinol methylase
VREPSDVQERERARRHFEIERELAGRLREASKDERRTLYAEVYEELFRRVEMPGNREGQRAQVGLLRELLGPFVKGRASFLEIGAGTCDLSLAMAAEMDRVWAVDAVEPSIPAGSAPLGFRFVHASELAEVVPRSGVEVAMSCHFVEHLHPDDLQDHLREVVELLNDDGVYVVVTPNRVYGPHDISKGFSDRAVGLHLREYTHADLAVELGRAGFGGVRAIGRIGVRPRRGRLGLVSAVERLLEALPGGVRRAVLATVPRPEPFRPLEQVKLVGFKSGRGVGPA